MNIFMGKLPVTFASAPVPETYSYCYEATYWVCHTFRLCVILRWIQLINKYEYYIIKSKIKANKQYSYKNCGIWDRRSLKSTTVSTSVKTELIVRASIQQRKRIKRLHNQLYYSLTKHTTEGKWIEVHLADNINYWDYVIK